MDLTAALKAIGAVDPGSDTALLLDLERRLGVRLHADTRALIRAAPELMHPDAEGHPEIDGLPFGFDDVDTLLEGLSRSMLGGYLAAVHFVGLVPVGLQLQYGDFHHALARLDGGVLCLADQELGDWGWSAAAFLRAGIAQFRNEVDGQLDGLDDDELEDFEPHLDSLRDCFLLRDCDPRAPTPEPAPVPSEWEATWKADARRLSERSWMAGFFQKSLLSRDLGELPTVARWRAQRGSVGRHYGDTMYWLLAHAVLDNRAELEEARRLAAHHPSSHIQAVLGALPAIADRFGPQREALYTLARKSRPD